MANRLACKDDTPIVIGMAVIVAVIYAIVLVIK